MPFAFDDHLKEIRKALTERLNMPSGRGNPADKTFPPFPTYTLEDGTKEVLYHLDHAVWVESNRLRPEEEEADEDKTDEENDETDDDPHSRAEHIGTPEEESASQKELKAGIPQSLFSPYADQFFERYSGALPEEIDETYLPDPSIADKMTREEKYLFTLMARELEYMSTHEIGGKRMAVTTAQKAKKALHTFAMGRKVDAVNLLKSARADDVNNRMISFLISQILYLKAHQGSSGSLPEARKEAAQACFTDDRIEKDTMMHIRYQTIASEVHLWPERALNLMRDYYMLNPEGLTGPEGFALNEFLHLKTLILLSKIPLKHWKEFEIESVAEVVQRVPGGALIYLFFFRDPIIEALEAGKTAFNPFLEVEKNLNRSYQMYERIRNTIDKQFTSVGTLEDGPKHTWTIQYRYLQHFMNTAPVPEYDEILMFCSLDGRRYESGSYPDPHMQDEGLIHNLYWRTWCSSISPIEDLRGENNVLPFDDVASDSMMMKDFDALMESLEEAELEIIDPERWSVCTEYLSPYSFDNLLETSAGRSLPPQMRGPDNSFFRPYYSLWAGNRESLGHLPSEVIRQRAEKGMFANLKEVMAAFEGARILLDSPVSGLKDRFKAAWKRYKQEKGHTGAFDIDPTENLIEHISDFWWLYLVLLPLALLTFFAILSAGNTQDAIKTFVFLLLGIVVLGIIFTIYVAYKHQDDNNEPPRE